MPSGFSLFKEFVYLSVLSALLHANLFLKHTLLHLLGLLDTRYDLKILNVYIQFLFLFQVVIVGNGAVGKSSMIQRYCKGIFTKDYKKTIGVDFLEKHIT